MNQNHNVKGGLYACFLLGGEEGIGVLSSEETTSESHGSDAADSELHLCAAGTGITGTDLVFHTGCGFAHGGAVIAGCGSRLGSQNNIVFKGLCSVGTVLAAVHVFQSS